MQALYLASVFLHILSAVVWIGGMFFLILVVVPWMRRGNRRVAGSLLSETGRRFRGVGWLCFAVLVVTGSFNLAVRGVGLSDFTRPEWVNGPFGRAVVLKLFLFALILVVSAVHDFVVGPRAARLMEADPEGAEALRLRRAASVLGRANALLSLLLVFLGVVLVRGWP